jgi:hypothetical protein
MPNIAGQPGTGAAPALSAPFPLFQKHSATTQTFRSKSQTAAATMTAAISDVLLLMFL